MNRCTVCFCLSILAALASCSLAVAPCAAGEPPAPTAARPDTLSSQEGQTIVSFEAGEPAPRKVYGPTRAGRIEGPEGSRYFRFLYSKADSANLPSHMIPHSGYSVGTASVPVRLNSILVFRYRSDGISDLRLGLKLTNQSLRWFLDLPESAEWTQMCLPLIDKLTRSSEGVTTQSLAITTFARLPEDRETVFMDVDDFRLEPATALSPTERAELEEGFTQRADDEQMLKQYVRVRNLRTDKNTYLQGEHINVRYDIVNTSDQRLTVPLSTQFTRPVHRIGTVQTWIEPLDDGAKTTDFGRAGRRGPRYAAGGAIFPMSRGLDHLEPGAELHPGRTIRTRLQPGRYRYYVEFKAIDGTQVNEEHVEFTVLPAAPDVSDAQGSQQESTPQQQQATSPLDLAAAGIQAVVIESDYHHLGDNRSPTAHNPDPEGITWSKQFSLDRVPAGTAYLSLQVENINAADLVINGHRLAIPVGHSPRVACPPVWRNLLLPLPSRLFRVGPNHISIESIWLPDLKTYDDFQFGKLAVSFH
ncbi:MAG: hypothetical protein JSV79_02510 [Armatimonadota bacterium]|nr:MAG: hypothetical protein JSV79_02510 [Armatimonadota bacterium]